MSLIMDTVRAVKARLSPAEREFLQIWPAVSQIEGLLVSPMQERWLFNAARNLPDGANIVEIGSFKGRSTTCLACGVRGTKKRVFAIDTFEGNQKDFKKNESYAGKTFFTASYYETFLGNLRANGVSDYVTPLRGASSEAGKTWNKPIHLLFIDGGHEFDDVLADFKTFYPHVVPGGLIAFHDVHDFKSNPDGPAGFPGVDKVWQEIASPLLTDLEVCASIAAGRKRPA